MKSKVVWKSDKQDWQTPAYVFEPLHAEFGFTLDAAASDENARCHTYFTEREDGLYQSWAGHRVWLNPPYDTIKLWMHKVVEEFEQGTFVVCLVPARTDTNWWGMYARKASKIIFVQGRIRFWGAPAGAPFPSAILVFNPAHLGPQQVNYRSFARSRIL